MNRKDLIERVKKLLALSQSSNEAEARQAAERARELIARWNIEASEIEKGDIGIYNLPTGRRNFLPWERTLITAIAEAHFCAVLLSYMSPPEEDLFSEKVRRPEACFEIVGREVNRQVVFELFTYLREVAQGEARAMMKGRRMISKNAVLMGFAIGVGKALHNRSHNWTDSKELSALIVTEKAANADFIQRLYGDLATARSKKIDTKDEGFIAGFGAGQSVNLDRQVRGSVGLLEVKR